MATVYRNPKLDHQPVGPSPDGTGYSSYKEPDTRVPPKPLPVIKAVSVDGVAIAEEEILREAQHHPASNPGSALRAAAEALVIRQLLLNEAARLGLVDAAEWDAGQGAETQEELVIRRLMERELNVPRATVEECRRFYDLNASRFTTDPIYEARHILVAAPQEDEKSRDEARGLAQEICNGLALDPSQFAALAEIHSACPSRSQGGNLGQLTRGSTVPEFESALGELEEGEITRSPVATRFGYHVIALDRMIGSEQLSFEPVRTRIADWLEAQAWSKAASQYISLLAGKAKILGVKLNAAEGPLIQ